MNGAAITRADLAEACIEAMLSPEAANTTFEIASKQLAKDEPDTKVSTQLFEGLRQGFDSQWTTERELYHVVA